jgi:hypothetical protein
VAVLEAEPAEPAGNWSAREKLKRRDALELARVVRRAMALAPAVPYPASPFVAKQSSGIDADG